MSTSIKKSVSKSEKTQVRKNNPKSAVVGKTAKEIVKRHLSDENDKITEDDLKHVKIDLSVPKDRAHKPLPIKKGKQRPKDSQKDNTTLTPWDVVSE